MNIPHLLLVLLIAIVWGFNFVVIKTGLLEIPPMLLCCFRFFLTSLPAVFFIKRPKVPFKMVAAYGLVMFAIQFSFLFIGMHLGVPAGITSVLLQTQVFFSIFLGVISFKERLGIWRIIGSIISFSGISMIGFETGGAVSLGGFIFVLAAAATWAFGNVISKKMKDVNSLSLVIWGSLVAWPPLLLASLLLEGSTEILFGLHHLSWLAFSSILYLAYMSTIFAYASWNWLLQRHAMTVLTPFTLLIPIFGIFSAILVLKEPFYLWEGFAALLVMIGLSINRFMPQFFDKKDKLE